MATVTIIFRKDKFNQKGQAPIHFRIIKNRKVTYIASGIMISKEHWDEKKNKVKSNHKNSARLNSYITNKFTEIQDTVLEHETISKSLTSRMLKDKVFGKKPSDFFSFADEVVEKYKREGKIGTYYKNQSIVTKLKGYKLSQQLTFHEINSEFLSKYEQYLRSVHRNKTRCKYT
jgi:integrase/recombinase XerD